jgi:hypothetical protein
MVAALVELLIEDYSGGGWNRKKGFAKAQTKKKFCVSVCTKATAVATQLGWHIVIAIKQDGVNS